MAKTSSGHLSYHRNVLLWKRVLHQVKLKSGLMSNKSHKGSFCAKQFGDLLLKLTSHESNIIVLAVINNSHLVPSNSDEEGFWGKVFFQQTPSLPWVLHSCSYSRITLQQITGGGGAQCGSAAGSHRHDSGPSVAHTLWTHLRNQSGELLKLYVEL